MAQADRPMRLMRPFLTSLRAKIFFFFLEWTKKEFQNCILLKAAPADSNLKRVSFRNDIRKVWCQQPDKQKVARGDHATATKTIVNKEMVRTHAMQHLEVLDGLRTKHRDSYTFL